MSVKDYLNGKNIFEVGTQFELVTFMRMVDLIEKKKDNVVLTDEEIHELIQEYTKGDIPDYQMSAMMMAIYFQGMTKEVTLQLTLSMARCIIEDSQAYPFKSEDDISAQCYRCAGAFHGCQDSRWKLLQVL